MEILYKPCKENDYSIFKVVDITNCYLKKIQNKNDYKITTPKYHSHLDYEVHMVFEGKQVYNIDGNNYELFEGDFILIPPGVIHRNIQKREHMLKYSLLFNNKVFSKAGIFLGKIPKNIIESIEFISTEHRNKNGLSDLLVENRVFEIIVTLLKIYSAEEGSNFSPILGMNSIRKNTSCCIDNEKMSENTMLTLAKDFISDNIERNLSVADVAGYCNLSTRQLTRIFSENEYISPGKYIQIKKMEKISMLLKNTSFSLQQISETFSYNNEYYFNQSFKKYFGISPYAYRRMFKVF